MRAPRLTSARRRQRNLDKQCRRTAAARGVDVLETIWNRIDEGFRRDQIVGIAAIDRPARELREVAEILAAAQTVFANTAGAVQPRHADPRAFPELSGGRSVVFNRADHLMARDHVRFANRKFPFDDVQVRAAHAACPHTNQNLALARLRPCDRAPGQRRCFNRRGRSQDPAVHSFTFASIDSNHNSRRHAHLSAADRCARQIVRGSFDWLHLQRTHGRKLGDLTDAVSRSILRTPLQRHRVSPARCPCEGNRLPRVDRIGAGGERHNLRINAQPNMSHAAPRNPQHSDKSDQHEQQDSKWSAFHVRVVCKRRSREIR